MHDSVLDLGEDCESSICAPDADCLTLAGTARFARPGNHAYMSTKPKRAARAPKVRSLGAAVELGLKAQRRAEREEERKRVAFVAEQARLEREAAQRLASRKVEWARRGRAGLVADLTAVGWKVDAGDLRRLVLRRGEGEIALSLPFSPADACELEDRHGWAFLPWF